MTKSRIINSAALGLALAVLAAPTAGAQPQDLRSPDAQDAGGGTAVAPAPGTDLRSPDARDVANGRGTFSAPEVTVVRVTEPSTDGGGLDWADAGIGAGALLGLILVGVGGTFAIVHRRHTTAARRATIA
jgi:hypothetical protein